MKDKLLLAIYILEILKKYSSPQSRLTQAQIMKRLDTDYTISITRKTLSNYLVRLKEEGYIEGQRGVYIRRDFSDNELKYLIDSILYAKHMPDEQAITLIEKLRELSPSRVKNRAKHISYLSSMNHTDNMCLDQVVEGLEEAIEKNRKVQITTCRYNLSGKLVDTGTSIISPYYIVSSMSRYYVICYDDCRGQYLENRRLDRITQVEVLSEPRRKLDQSASMRERFHLGQYMKEHLYMFSGPTGKVRIAFKEQLVGIVIDWFGKDFRFVKQEGDMVTVELICNEDAFYHLALQYGEHFEIIAPDHLRKRMKEGLEKILKKYQ